MLTKKNVGGEYGQLEKERECPESAGTTAIDLQENHMAYVSELQQDFERKLTEDKIEG